MHSHQQPPHQQQHHHHSNSHDNGGSGGGGGGGGSSFSKTWELNQYELNRLPHEIIYDDRTIAVSPKVLQNELMCPICLDILKHTMTTKECLHRFCQECIITALRAGNKECPTCRKKLVSKRSLRPDPNFDAIIAKIYPNREEYDALHEKVLEKLNKKHLTMVGLTTSSTASSATTTNRGRAAARSLNNAQNSTNNNNNSAATAAAEATSSNGRSHKRPNSTSHTASAAASAATADSNEDSGTYPFDTNRYNRENSILFYSDLFEIVQDMESRTSTEQSSTHCGLQADSDEIELVLKPHPLKELTLTSKRFLKTTSNATSNKYIMLLMI